LLIRWGLRETNNALNDVDYLNEADGDTAEQQSVFLELLLLEENHEVQLTSQE
jgi:hypothetical protein